MFDELIEMIDFQKELFDLNMKNLEQLVKQKEREAQQGVVTVTFFPLLNKTQILVVVKIIDRLFAV